MKKKQHRAEALLVARGAKIDAYSRLYPSPLFFAAAKGHTMVVKLLLARGADCKVFDGQDFTPLEYATGEAVKILQQHSRKRTAPYKSMIWRQTRSRKR